MGCVGRKLCLLRSRLQKSLATENSVVCGWPQTYFLVFQAALGVGTSDPRQFQAASKPVWGTLMLDASLLLQIPK